MLLGLSRARSHAWLPGDPWGQPLLGQRRRRALQGTPKVREGVGCEQGVGPDHLQRLFQGPAVLGLCGDAAGAVQGEHHGCAVTRACAGHRMGHPSPGHPPPGHPPPGHPSAPQEHAGGWQGAALCLDSPQTTRSIKMGWSPATAPVQTPMTVPTRTVQTLNRGWFLVPSARSEGQGQLCLGHRLSGHGSKWIFISQLMPGLSTNCFSVFIYEEKDEAVAAPGSL